MSAITFVVEVDWNDDGDFLDANDDITADVLSYQYSRGRREASQIFSRASVGQLNVIVDNTDGKYSSFNVSSPLTGNIFPGRKIKLRTTSPVAGDRWTGFIDEIIPSYRSGRPIAEIRASGPFSMLSGFIEVAKQENQTTGQLIGDILDAADWPAGDRSIDTGQAEVPIWYIGDIKALDAAREIEETEFGFLSEGADGNLVFEDRHHRLKSPHLTSQATYSDGPTAALPYVVGTAQQDVMKNLYTKVEVLLQPLSVQSTQVLWTFSGTLPVLPPSTTIVIWAIASDAIEYVDTWVTPVVGTDVDGTFASSWLSVSATKYAKSMEITLENTSSVRTITLSQLQARGSPVEPADPILVTSEDATAQGQFGIRTYKFPGRSWSGNFNDAQALTDFLLAHLKELRPAISLRLPANAGSTITADALARDISDRVTFQAQNELLPLGINQDFFIEGIAESYDASQGILDMTLLLSPVLSEDAFWILGTSELGSDTRLAY